MRAHYGWSELHSARVGVWGLGVEGSANLRKLESLGVEPVLVDDRADGPNDGLDVLPTAEGGLDALSACDVVVKTPGISRYRDDLTQLEAGGVPVLGGLGLWLEEVDRSRVVCITGTKGKSTTTAIMTHLLNGLGRDTLACGNLGQPPYDPDLSGSPEFWIVETSSYQATDLGSSPPVTAVTSLHPDHLDWHGSADRYFADKLSMCHQPGAVLTVANGEDALLLSRRAELAPEVEAVVAPENPLAWVAPLGLLGRHNTINALIARASMTALGIEEAADEAALEAAASDFPALESRLQPVFRIGDVDFVDDSLSTNVLPTLAAVDAFPDRRVALIAGGFDRGIDYLPLAEGLARRRLPLLVLTVPDSGPRISAALEARPSVLVETTACEELPSAVQLAYEWAAPDGVVLLSPAAPSFGRYENYQVRAAAFLRAAQGLSEMGPC